MPAPKLTHCKRGHELAGKPKPCVPCRRLRERLRYKENAEFREAKKKQTREYKRAFREQNGFWQAELYRK
jgi:hypothetical protein